MRGATREAQFPRWRKATLRAYRQPTTTMGSGSSAVENRGEAAVISGLPKGNFPPESRNIPTENLYACPHGPLPAGPHARRRCCLPDYHMTHCHVCCVAWRGVVAAVEGRGVAHLC